MFSLALKYDTTKFAFPSKAKTWMRRTYGRYNNNKHMNLSFFTKNFKQPGGKKRRCESKLVERKLLFRNITFNETIHAEREQK